MSSFKLVIIVLTFLASSLIACGKESEPAPAASTQATTPTPTGEHAPAGYVPGTHEDWCGGHGVPESACTRCNPKLIPAFKATGDWCAEHGLPESQCKACNPGLVITRPPKVAP
ncbi:MAG TPA: hypothetical protein PK095_11815 [Myxococcota bacterium]|nr:hypothetical protein [Myxococcota bacterium]